MEAVDTINRMCGRRCPVHALVEDGRIVKIEGTPGHGEECKALRRTALIGLIIPTATIIPLMSFLIWT